jgi:glycosyltransferase involved in cell wall biosynthesis
MNISVVIPTLNESENLSTCLRNINPQLQPGDELIVVDGGSEDGTVGIAESFGATVYINEGESTIGGDRDIGARKASNPIVATLDADSVPPKGWLDRVRWNFEDDPDLALVWGTIQDLNGVPIRDMVGKFSTVFRGASGNNTAFRRKYFKEVDGYPEISFMEDSLFINRMSLEGKIRRDEELVMVMNMERKRYQTIPILGIGGASALVSRYAQSEEVKEGLLGFGLGLVGTELTYELFSGHGTGIHHDHIGLAAMAAGEYGKNKKRLITGIGGGMFVHHAVTEGVSMAPTKIEEETEEVIGAKQ